MSVVSQLIESVGAVPYLIFHMLYIHSVYIHILCLVQIKFNVVLLCYTSFSKAIHMKMGCTVLYVCKILEAEEE